MIDTTVSVTTRFNADEIRQTVIDSQAPDHRQAMAEHIMQLRDEGVRNALTELGWATPEQIKKLREDSDDIERHFIDKTNALLSLLRRINSEWNARDQFSDEWIERMADIIGEAPDNALAKHDAEKRAEGAEAVRDRLREKANAARVSKNPANSDFYRRCANVAGHKAGDYRRQAKEAL
ncbi:MAG: hypothetical protein CME72_11715 [Halomonadaceae bacterium]|nr:hypothetical protein [Halomonadaceae bacterium]